MKPIELASRMTEAGLAFWKKSFTFSGTTSRKETWIVFGFNAAIIIVANLAFKIIQLTELAILKSFWDVSHENWDMALDGTFAILQIARYLILIIILLYVLGSIIPGIAMFTRRVRDAGYNPLVLLLTLVPIAGLAVPLAFMFIPSKKQKNLHQ